MPVSIGILTCRRRSGAVYLFDTIAAIDREGGAGVETKTIFVDGDTGFDLEIAPRVPAGWSVVPLGRTEFSCGAAAYKGALAQLARARQDVLMFEDDVALCRRAVERMIATEVPSNAGLVSFFDMKEYPPGSPTGLFCIRPSVDPKHCIDKPAAADYLGLWGSQCYRFPIDVVEWLVAQDWTKARLWPHGQDLVVGNLLEQHPSRSLVAFHIPCIVEHVGLVSAYSPFGLAGRTATNFIGREADAMALPVFAPEAP